ncbi:MAG TPA: LysE family translocator [Candidatus Corynebacterium avicola]|uniref:LysE family translocator n=1 Tax=Candidatus Corynebacterium avicola TaxID=2838527 RepID=A0A9D1RPR1_9CORY|nr:LysE family translocator [Candidatus Corynebacterium avicola]
MWGVTELLDPSRLGALVVASVVLIAVPGPSVLFVVGRALSHGRDVALLTAVGNAVGCYSAGVLVAFGLGPLLERWDLLFQLFKWGGVLFLVWIGVQAIRHAGPVGEGDADQVAGTSSRRKAVRDGAIVGFTNPKNLIMFTVVVPQFISQDAGDVPLQMILLGLVPLIVGMVCDCTWALTAATARGWLTRSAKRVTTVQRIGGASVIAVGASVAVSS